MKVSIRILPSSDELFDVMCRIEAELKVHFFFVMDETFLLHHTRAMRLLERMKQAGKSWELSVFASANAIRKYTMLELVELGISWVWMGLESPRSRYGKLQGHDLQQLTGDLRVRERFSRQVKNLIAYNAALWVMEREFKKVNRTVSEEIHQLRRQIEKEFPVIARFTAASLGPILLRTTRREEKRLAEGRTYEPPTFLDRRNWSSVL